MGDRGWGAVLRLADFRLLWMGSTLSALGSQLTALALPLFVLQQTGSPAAAGLVATARMLVSYAVQLPGGVMADRLDRRSILLAADIGRAAALAGVGVVALARPDGTVWLIVALMSLEGMLTTVANLAATAAVPHLVPERQRPAALALGHAQHNAVLLVGPLAGAVLYQLHPAVPFVLDAVSYVLALGLLLLVRAPLGGGRRTASSVRGDIAVGLRFVVRSRYLLLMIGWSALMNFATAGVGFVLVLAVGSRNGGLSLGVSLTVMAAAGLAGAVLAPRFRDTDEDRLIRTATALIVALGVVGALSPDPVALTVCTAGIAFLSPVIVVPKNARVYALVPDELMGRVQSSLFLIGGSLYPFATFVTGRLVETGSARTAMWVHVGVLALVLVISAVPQFSRSAALTAGAERR
ncbi:MFS transporter [Streptomyces sp. A012304]|uniref:MFS transporter n=1 Tax=Streptomyces sp. A012304 TaxID=375446 RepID=UPI0022310AF0|nr:MFS transporter [Streptomyces sp. A012304]GKQ40597.1 MFS transporter [Streptomyces sp. A012304]